MTSEKTNEKMKIPCPICGKTDFYGYGSDICYYCGWSYDWQDYEEFEKKGESLGWVQRLRNRYEESVKKYGDEYWLKRAEKEDKENAEKKG